MTSAPPPSAGFIDINPGYALSEGSFWYWDLHLSLLNSIGLLQFMALGLLLGVLNNAKGLKFWGPIFFGLSLAFSLIYWLVPLGPISGASWSLAPWLSLTMMIAFQSLARALLACFGFWLGKGLRGYIGRAISQKA